MLNVEVYISDQKIDLYENETIQLVDSIQNLKEPDKAFSGYTKQFSVPASKTNNKVFKHFYNADVTGGFDARIRTDAKLTINGFDFRRGQMKLNSCRLRDGRPDFYSIVFYGDTSRIKESISDNNISTLSGLSQYNHDYTFANIKDGFELGLGLSGGNMVRATGLDKTVVYPFISHTKQYIYDSTASPPIYNISDSTEALDHTQLKPAIRFKEIFDGIEDTFGIDFDRTGFLGSDDFLGMYLWLHKDKGGIVGVSDNVSFIFSNDFTITTGTDRRTNGLFYVNGTSHTFEYDFTITGSGTWDVVIYNINEPIYEEKGMTGNQTITIDFPSNSVSYAPHIKVISAGTITAIDVELTEDRSGSETNVFDISAITPNDFVDISSNMPVMSVMDFLSSTLNMFNLILERRADGSYYVETMDDYYNAGTTRDITDMVDPRETNVEPSRPYDILSFKFTEADSYLMQKRYELLGDRYGDDSFRLGNLFEDNNYEVELGFEKILFEKMDDTGSSSDNNLWAWAVDDNTDPYVGDAPIVFYYDTSLTSTDIEWDSDSSTSTFYARCSNTVTEGNSATWYTLGFKPEIDEYDLVTNNGSLFSEYWGPYIEGVYREESRRVKLNAVLTPGFLLNYSLADTIRYRDRDYFLDELDVNINTGEAVLNLITKWL